MIIATDTPNKTVVETKIKTVIHEELAIIKEESTMSTKGRIERMNVT
jgi:hypothetical protein